MQLIISYLYIELIPHEIIKNIINNRRIKLKNNKLRILVECSLMVAIATVLGYIPLFRMPQGGTITLGNMIPLVLVSFRHGLSWGVLTGGSYGIINMLLDLKNIFYATTIWAMLGVIFLDYLLSYAIIGFACFLAKPIPKRGLGIAVGTMVTGLLRYFCIFISGILIWYPYAPEGTPVWIYSLIYNGSYMIPEIIMTTILTTLITQLLVPRELAKDT